MPTGDQGAGKLRQTAKCSLGIRRLPVLPNYVLLCPHFTRENTAAYQEQITARPTSYANERQLLQPASDCYLPCHFYLALNEEFLWG